MVKKVSKKMESLDKAVATAVATEKSVPLTQQELIALAKAATKTLEEVEKRDGKLGAFSADVNFNVKVNGTVVRAASTSVTPSFSISDFLKALMLKYATTLDNPEEWLTQIMSAVLPKVVELGADKVISTVPENLQKIWNTNEAKAKDLFQAITEKNPRSGNTTVNVSLEKEKR